jgi:hypothetical protein
MPGAVTVRIGDLGQGRVQDGDVIGTSVPSTTRPQLL